MGAEFASANLGDARRTRRLQAIANSAASAPDAGFPHILRDGAELEATYRLLSNDAVDPDAMLEPHIAATLRRMGELGTALVIHDTTYFNFGGASPRVGLGSNNGKGQGFAAHIALAVVPGEDRLPLGVCALERVNRLVSKGTAKKSARQICRDPERESLRWHRNFECVEEAAPVSVVHVMDREGDSYDLLAKMVGCDARFVVRASYDRALVGEEEPLFAFLEKQICRASRSSELSHRSHVKRKECSQRRFPERRGRQARLSVSAATVALQRPRTANNKMKSLTLNVVRVWEAEPPPGEPPVEWTLYTSEPIGTKQQLLRVVDIYRARWMIEEYFKALKTGCSLERRQLESYDALSRALALFVPIAWRLLLARGIARAQPDSAASTVLTRTELTVLQHRQGLDAPPQTAEDALNAVASLGGHLKRNGPPGWMTIGRGMEMLYLLVAGWKLANGTI